MPAKPSPAGPRRILQDSAGPRRITQIPVRPRRTPLDPAEPRRTPQDPAGLYRTSQEPMRAKTFDVEWRSKAQQPCRMSMPLLPLPVFQGRLRKEENIAYFAKFQ